MTKFSEKSLKNNFDILTNIKFKLLLEFDIDTSMSFKEAKKSFKRQYISKLLKVRFGNVAEVAKIAKVDRRSIHRFVAEMKVDVKKLRESSLYMKQVAVQNIIQEALEQYKGALNPVKYQAMYAEAPTLSKDIAKELPELPSSLKQAEHDFEKRFLTRALKENKWNISKTARKIGLRFETLHRKMKNLDIKKENL